MPTYGYHCSRCQTEFEVFQRMTDDPVADCPTCGTAGRRLFYPAGIVFKGSGFYKTDSRAARSSASTTGEKKAEPVKSGDGASGGSASGDTAGGGAPQKSAGTAKKAATSSAAAAEA